MTVYYYDLFTGTAGTLLTSHTADSGATWPNDADHYYGTGIVTLDGLGGVYQSNTGSSINLSSAAMPSTQNFEVLFSYIRKTSIAANAGLIFLSSPWPTIADCYELFYAEGDGWLLYHTSISGSTSTLLAGPYAGPAFGVTWYMKVDVSTSGGNTTFTVYYSTASTGPFTQLFSYTAATSTDLVAVGTWFYNPSTASTATTGQHIGALTVQDTPVLSSATLSGPTQQLFSNPAAFTVVLNEPAGTGGVVVTPSSSNGSDTFQATQGGANVTSTTLAAGQLNGMFWLTPGGATGNRTITITTSPTLTCPGSPFTYNALPAATGYTVTGATGGHQLIAAIWTISLTGGDFAGTITATPGGGPGQCQIFSPTLITFTGNGTLSKTFSFTPLDVDSVTFTFTNSGSLTNPSPKSYLSIGEYLADTFVGTSGTSIQSHTSNTLPDGVVGSTYTTPSAGAISLDGSGGTYLRTAGTAISLSNAVMPRNINCEFIFKFENMSSVPGAYAGIVLMSSGSKSLYFWWDGGYNQLFWAVNGVSQSGYGGSSGPAVGASWLIKLDVQNNPNNSGQGLLYSQYSTDGGSTWSLLFTDAANPGTIDLTLIPTTPAAGLVFQGTAVTPTTGPHISNLTVQDPAPAPPTCQISQAYVTTSGQLVAFFFETISGSTPVFPTAMNFAPTFFQNGTSIGVGTNAWVTGQHSCAIVQFQPGVQINNGDTVTVSTASSWMSCGTTNACNGVTNLTVSSAHVGKSCFGTDTLVKTFKPGLNFSDLGTTAGTRYNIPMNWRFRLQPAEAGSTNTTDGYPTVMLHTTEVLPFLDLNSSNSIDSTAYPGVPGYWAIGFDDNYLANSGSPTTLTIVSLDTTKSVVTQITGNNNPGSGGLNQYYLFNVQAASGSTTANLPIGLQFANSAYTPYVSNLWIVGPGDFTVPASGNTTWSFSRTGNPYAFSGQFSSRLANGAGSMRFADAWLTYGSQSNLSEAWELRGLTGPDGVTPAFSWNNSLINSYQINFATARPLNLSVSPYVYSEWAGTPYNLTLNTGVTATQTSFSINAGSDGWAIPLAGLLLTMGTGEKCRIINVTGTSNPYTCTVERGSSGTTAASQSAGTISCASRVNITSLSTVGAQLVEVVTTTNHNQKTGMTIGFSWGSYPNMTFTDGSTNNLGGNSYPLAVTGPLTLVVDMRSAATPPVTLSTSYTLSPPSTHGQFSQPDVGFPIDYCAIIAGSSSGCHIHVNIPPIASDSLCYAIANRVKNNFPAGRKVYIELADEWWNYAQSEIYIGNLLTSLAYGTSADPNTFYVVRTGQIRTIFRNVFGSRANEIHAMLNVAFISPGYGEQLLNLAIAHGVTVDTYAAAPYVDPDGSAASITAWNNSATIPQMIDLWIHDLYYKSNAYNALVGKSTDANGASHMGNIAAYNAATGGSCFLFGYEGGFETGAPAGANNLTTLSHDLPYDPNWRIIEQDFYALLQTSGFVNINVYSYDIYYAGSDNWGLYHSPYQPYGKGDGSDGKANNRLCLATPGFTYSKASTTNQDEQNVSVRGQALLEWMQPAQAKKRMLFVPYRFVKR